jgi:hypothetical protein
MPQIPEKLWIEQKSRHVKIFFLPEKYSRDQNIRIVLLW